MPFKGTLGFYNRVPFEGSCKGLRFGVYLKVHETVVTRVINKVTLHALSYKP